MSYVCVWWCAISSDVVLPHPFTGSAADASCGTTNLHIDISDAVNVMVSPSPLEGGRGTLAACIVELIV